MMHITKKHIVLLIIVTLIIATISCSLFNRLGSEQAIDEASEEGQVQEDSSHDSEESSIGESGETDAEEVESQGVEADGHSVSGVGMSRANPIPLGTLISIPGWDIQVLELLRGEAAAAMVNSGDRKFDPPPEGYEYALAKVFVRCTSMDEKAHSLSSELTLSGSSHIKYADQMDGWPAPEFVYEDMFIAESVEGWIDTLIPVAEENLIVVLDAKDWDSGFETLRYFELEEGASIVPSGAMFEQTPNDVGVNPDQPASIGELMIMTEWDITVLSSLRGEEALSSLRQESPNYSGPEEGDEYILLEVVIHYFGSEDTPVPVYDSNFYIEVEGSTYRGRIRYPMKSEFTWINSTVFPGAAVMGWTILSLPEGIANPVIIYNPGEYTGSGEELRYITIP